MPLLASGSVMRLAFAIQTVVVARELGVAGYGALGIAMSYTAILFQFLDSRSWECLLRFAPGFVARGRADLAGRLTRTLFTVDAATAGVAALIILAMAGVVSELFGLPPYGPRLVTVYALVLPASFVTPVSLGLLRLADEHRWVAAHEVTTGVVQLVLVVVALAADATPVAVAGALVVAAALKSVLALLLARWLAWAKVGLTEPGATRLGDHRREVVRFLFATNFHALVKGTRRNADTLVVGALIGPVAVGSYKLAKNMADLFGFATQPLYQVGYSRMAVAVSAPSERARLLRRYLAVAALLSGVMYLAYLLVGGRIILAVLGDTYEDAVRLLPVMLAAEALLCVVQFVHGALVTGGQVRRTIIAVTAGTAVQFAFLLVLVPPLGVAGAALSFAAFALVDSAVLWHAYRSTPALTVRSPTVTPDVAAPIGAPSDDPF